MVVSNLNNMVIWNWNFVTMILVLTLILQFIIKLRFPKQVSLKLSLNNA